MLYSAFLGEAVTLSFEGTLNTLSRRAFLAAAGVGAAQCVGCGPGDSTDAPADTSVYPTVTDDRRVLPTDLESQPVERAGHTEAAADRNVRPTEVRPNIVFVVLDTVRPDHMSCFGHSRPTTPFIEGLLDASRVYEHAYSASPWTLPSHTSMFTGLHSLSHKTTWENLRLDDKFPTLASVLQEHGYKTYCSADNALIGPGTGLSRGFEVYKHLNRREPSPENDPVLRLGEFVDDAQENPFFLFVNLIPAHDPYNTSLMFFKCFLTDPKYSERYKIDVLRAIIYEDAYLDKEWLPHLAEHYDAEIRYDDYLVEQFVKTLKEKGKWDNTLFIVVSDHGENLGDHGLLNHQFCLYETLLHVPMVIRFPENQWAGTVETNKVQLTDLFPTILDRAGVDISVYLNQGRSLMPGKTTEDRDIFAEYYIHTRFGKSKRYGKFWDDPKMLVHKRRLKSFRRGDYKLIWGSDGLRELYNLVADPVEEMNLASSQDHGPKLAELEGALKAHLLGLDPNHEQAVEEATAPVSTELEEDLKALGYL